MIPKGRHGSPIKWIRKTSMIFSGDFGKINGEQHIKEILIQYRGQTHVSSIFWNSTPGKFFHGRYQVVFWVSNFPCQPSNQPPSFRSPYQPCLECAKRSEARSMVPKLPASASEMDSVEKIKKPPSSNTRRASWRNGRMEYLDLSDKIWRKKRFRFFFGDLSFVSVTYFKERLCILWSGCWYLLTYVHFIELKWKCGPTIINLANLPQKILAIHLFRL